MSKYTMLLIGPVFLIALLKKPKKLFSPMPYLGGVLCVLFLSPHLIWNANHEFVSFKFQINRGFFSDYSATSLMANKLPRLNEFVAPVKLSAKKFDEKESIVVEKKKRKEIFYDLLKKHLNFWSCFRTLWFIYI